MDNALSELREALRALKGRATMEEKDRILAAAQAVGKDKSVRAIQAEGAAVEARYNAIPDDAQYELAGTLKDKMDTLGDMLSDADETDYWPWPSAAAKADAEQPNDVAMDNGPAGGRRSRRKSKTTRKSRKSRKAKRSTRRSRRM